MKKYLICNDGCDDRTEFEMELTEEQAQFLIKVFEANNKIADYQCKPSLYICSNYTKKIDEYDSYVWYQDKSYMNKGYEELKGE